MMHEEQLNSVSLIDIFRFKIFLYYIYNFLPFKMYFSLLLQMKITQRILWLPNEKNQ